MSRMKPTSATVLCFGIGIILSRPLPWNSSILCLGLVFLFVTAAYYFHKPRIFMTSIYIIFVLVGVLYTQTYALPVKNYIGDAAKYYRRQPAVIEGMIISDVDQRRFNMSRKFSFTINVFRVKSKWGWKEYKGKVLVQMFQDHNLRYGDVIRLEGKLHRPFEFKQETNFSYRAYLLHRNIPLILSVKKKGECRILKRNQGQVLRALALKLRAKLRTVLESSLSVNEAGIMKAILLGDRSAIPAHVRELFVQTGTVHILAISGLHVGAVAAVFLLGFKFMRFPRRGQHCLTILLLIMYVFMTGQRPSVLRASLMLSLFLFSFNIEKEANVFNSLSIAAFVLLLFNPFYLLDVGFQLSFLCVLSIIYLSPKVKKLFAKSNDQPRSKLMLKTIDLLSVSLAVWIGVAGCIAYYFQIITPVTIAANMVIVPFIFIIVSLGLFVMISGLAWPAVTFAAAACLKVLLNIMVGIIFLFSKMPFAFQEIGQVSYVHVAAYYFVIFCIFHISWSEVFFYIKNKY